MKINKNKLLGKIVNNFFALDFLFSRIIIIFVYPKIIKNENISLDNTFI